MEDDPVRRRFQLQTPWQTAEPFLFCMHHEDRYPPGDEQMGPDTSLAGRELGNDFSGKDGWNMYHGRRVPGFPRHPHRGFETITIVRNGSIDHADSLGATARFGAGDVQWMTAGEGIVHSEMFPLIHRDRSNPTELLQIWLNLPPDAKEHDPSFEMFWADEVPTRRCRDGEGRRTELRVIAGDVEGVEPPDPPSSSWASHEEAGVAIWLLSAEPEAICTLPPGDSSVERRLYVFEGDGAVVGGESVRAGEGVDLDPDSGCRITNGDAPSAFLLLQGRPIGEPIVKRGPFVMNTQAEIRRAMLDYRNDGFGGWPWDEDAPVHRRDRGRFAVHADGRQETPDG